MSTRHLASTNCLALALLCFAAAPRGDVIPADAGAAAQASTLSDAPLASWRVELLELAFDAASALPLQPHVKTRCSAQESVAVACLRLDQPQRALRYGERIENWRRGAVLADYAYYCVERGATADVPAVLERAEALVHALESDPDEQAWRPDRIRVKIAATHALLGERERAAELTRDLAPSEAGKLEALEARRADADRAKGAEKVDESIRALRAVVAAGDSDATRNALDVCTELVDRFWADAELRGRLEAAMEQAWTRAPRMVHIEVSMRLAEIALEHDDPRVALAQVAQAEAVLGSARWRAEDRVATMARLAGLRFRAGDAEGARAQALATEIAYEKEREQISSVFRARALRPLAEAYCAMGDAKQALATYARVAEEGALNPNARPRAEDLSATCLSLASHELEPDANLLARLHEIRAALTDPW